MAGLPAINNPLAVAPVAGGTETNPHPGFNPINVLTTQLFGNPPSPQAAPTTGRGIDTTHMAPTGQASAVQQPAAPTGGYSNPGAAIDPSTGLSYDALSGQVNSQLDNLGQQQQVGNQNILDAYNTSYNALTGSKALADRNYNTTKAQTLQDYVGARGNEQAQVGQQANSLQRLLGAHGYQGSANSAAAYAAARQGSIADQGLQRGYGRNQQALDTNYGDYNNQFNTQVGNLGHQKDVQQNALQASVDQNKQSLLQQLAQIATAKGGNPGAYTSQIGQLGQQITQLGQQYANPVLQATPPTYQAPSLESYATPAPAAPTINNAPGAASNLNPFLNVLLGQQDKQKNLNNIGV